MEEYVNENTIVKNNIYDALKDSIMCSVCSKIMIEPLVCLCCQSKICKKCYNKIGDCNNNCGKDYIKEVIEKNNFITKFKFRCIKNCGEEIEFNDIKEHYKSNCAKKIKVLTPNEAAEYQKKGNKIPHISSKKN